MPRASTTLFEDAIDVPLWLEADRLTPYAERVRRDRDIGRRIRQRDRVAARARLVAQRGAGRRQPAPARVSSGSARSSRSRWRRSARVTGVAVALAAFAYDGSQPVNVVRLLALLVGVQLVLLALTLLLLPGRVPGLRRVQDLIAALNPGALGGRRLRQARARVARRRAAVRLARRARGAPALREVAAPVLVADRGRRVQRRRARRGDRARDVLGSRVRLEHDARRGSGGRDAHRAGDCVAVARSHPRAVPSAALVEQSQFFRLEAAMLAAASPRALGAWWPFTLLRS